MAANNNVPFFDFENDYRSEEEKAFVEAINLRTRNWSSLITCSDALFIGMHDHKTVLAVDVISQCGRIISYTIRVEFDGTGVLVGFDETGQLVTELNPNTSQALHDRSPEELANLAADWIENELHRFKKLGFNPAQKD